MHVMIDIETMGLANDSVILSIGAVKFDLFATGIDDTFHLRLATDAQERRGRKAYTQTAFWWTNQSKSARDQLMNMIAYDPEDVLEALHRFCKGAEGVWGNGTMFDNALVKSLAASFNMDSPWGYKLDRCYRTTKSIFPYVDAPEFDGIEHNALDDAIHQAQHLQMIYADLHTRSLVQLRAPE